MRKFLFRTAAQTLVSASLRTGEINRLSKYFLREWWVLSILGTCTALGLLFSGALSRTDNVLFGRLLQAQQRPANPDIIIIAIDNLSLSQLGRWPWPRDVHTQLLEKLSHTQPRALSFDVVFAEPERDTAVDQRFAAALRQYPKIFIPLIREGLIRENEVQKVIPPVTILAESVTKLGHIQVELDADGMARSVFLREGNAQQWWEHLAWLVYQTSAESKLRPTMPGACQFGLFDQCKEEGDGVGIARWQRDHLIHIPFTGPSGHYATIPYIHVLNGEVPAEFFRDKYVLIGATAPGMNDAYPTPVGALAGVEIHANTLDALLANRTIRQAPFWVVVVLTVLPVWLMLLGFLYLSPRRSVVLAFSLGGGIILLSALGLLYGRVWIPPMSVLLTLLLLYPIWVWRRLEAAVSYFGEELLRLDAEPHILPELPGNVNNSGDVLQQRIDAMQRAVARVRDLRRFIFDSVDHLPDATLVTDQEGTVLLANQEATELFESIHSPAVVGVWLPGLLRQLCATQKTANLAELHFDWTWLIDDQSHRLHAEILEQGIEIKDPVGRDLLVKSAPAVNAQGELVGWITSLIDLSAMRGAERQRDEMLRFLSHDMRSPQSSIIALLELQRQADTALPPERLYAELERHARRTLSLADDFVQITRAESQAYRFAELNLADLLMDAVDEIWSLARAKSISVKQDIDDEAYYIHADRGLLTRALLNLLSNAIKYSAANTEVVCRLSMEHDNRNADLPNRKWVRCAIHDQGFGISKDNQARLFQRFTRFAQDEHPRIDGFGLGLAFVKTVVERHQGTIHCESHLDSGTTFILHFPLVD